jgi:hypothetical protein
MAKKVLLDTYYTFNPSTNTLIIPRVIQRENLMLITNVTTNQVIYNFSDPDLNATSYVVKGSSAGSTTTIVLNYDCNNANMLSTDKIQVIYDEYDEKFTPSDNLVDAVAKMRVAAPQSLIDTDFEYGVQSSKWEALALTQNYPSFFSKGSGGDQLQITDITSNYGSSSKTKSDIVVLTTTAHGLSTNDVVSVQETLDQNAEGTFLITTKSAITGITKATDTLTSSSNHGLVQYQPIIFSAVPTSSNISTNTVYYVISVPTSTTFKISATITGTAITVSGTGTLDADFSRMFYYKANARVKSQSILDGNLTSVVPGGVFDNAHIPGGITGNFDTFGVLTGTSTLTTLTTSEPHGIIPGTPILINGVTTIGSEAGGGNSGFAYSTELNGSYIVIGIPSPTTLEILKTNGLGGAAPYATGTINNGSKTATLFCKPDAYIQHTSYNGGVQLSTANNVTGIQQIRQTRKTFRYQSGKSIQFSTGAKFTPSYNIESIKADRTSGTATVVVITVEDHGLQEGARVKIEGVNVVGGDYNPYVGDFLVTGVINQNTFSYQTTINPAFTYPTNVSPSGENSVVTVSTWAGACTRAGLYNEHNGIFLEYDGEKLWACKRFSNRPMYGKIAISQYGNAVTGTNTRFTKQLVVGDNVVIKGQTYKVTHIDSETSMRVNPSFRSDSITNASIYKVQTVRVPQNEFNLDRLDGTGPSGYILDPTKMQMIYIDYTWYGSGFIRYGMRMTNGDIYYFHKIPNNNLNTQSYMRSGNLPARYEVNNYAPRTRLIAGALNSTVTPNSGDKLAANATIMYVEDITGWRTVAPSKVDGDIIGYILIQQGTSSLEIVSYTKVGSYNVAIGGYPITIQRNAKQPLITGSFDGVGLINTSTSNRTVLTASSGTPDLTTQVIDGDIIYTSTGVKLGKVLFSSSTTLTLDQNAPYSPLTGSGGSALPYTDTKFIIVRVNSLNAGSSAKEFYPDSSVPGAIYQTINGVTISSANPSVFTLTSGTIDTTKIVAGMKVNVTDSGGSSVSTATQYYLAPSPTITSTTFGITNTIGGTAIQFTAGTNVSLIISTPEQTSVRVITQTCAPSLTHWGSSVIMDGRYDEDRGVMFNARMKKYLTLTSGQRAPVMSIRISPSVDNGIGRNFGKREVINTMQLVLQQLETIGTGPFLIEGVFNPNTLVDSTATLPTAWETLSVGSGSLAQVIFHDNSGTTGIDTAATGTISGGDTIFSFYTDNAGGTNLSATRYDLQSIKELGTSILSGNGSAKTPGYPNGPDVLTIVATNIGSAAKISSRISWTEAQA